MLEDSTYVEFAVVSDAFWLLESSFARHAWRPVLNSTAISSTGQIESRKSEKPS